MIYELSKVGNLFFEREKKNYKNNGWAVFIGNVAFRRNLTKQRELSAGTIPCKQKESSVM
jgi:hypothetical protein